jgi:hypothetical protein
MDRQFIVTTRIWSSFVVPGESLGIEGIGEGEGINLADPRATTHILEGDETGGGHAPGAGISNKSEFPVGWNNDKIMQYISDVATDPTSSVTEQGRTTIIEGTREGIDIKVVERDGRIVSGFPTNTPRNP